MSVVFAASFLFRSAVNIFIAAFPQAITDLQCQSVVNGSLGWVILVFSLQFFGETLPLSVLFYIQNRNAAPRKSMRRPSKLEPNSPVKTSPLLNKSESRAMINRT